MQLAVDSRRVPPRRLRDAAGRFPTGVTVVTVAAGERIRGMTVNGFMSVSLEPALIVVSIANSARTKPLLDAAGAYGVSVLSSEQRQLSAYFAGRAEQPLRTTFVGVDGVPLIEGALAHLAARVVDARPAGDHTLFIGEVTHAEVRPSGEPLVFHGGSYRTLERAPEYDWPAAWQRTTDWL